MGSMSLYMFLWVRKLMEEKGIKENNITSLYSLNLDLFVNIKKP